MEDGFNGVVIKVESTDGPLQSPKISRLAIYIEEAENLLISLDRWDKGLSALSGFVPDEDAVKTGKEVEVPEELVTKALTAVQCKKELDMCCDQFKALLQ